MRVGVEMPRNHWHAGKIEPIMIKPRFSIWKETRMAAATLAFGSFENHTAGDHTLRDHTLHQVVGVSGGRNLLESTLDPDSSLVSRCLRGDEPAWEELVRLHTRKVYA